MTTLSTAPLVHPAEPADDTAAIAALHRSVALQRAAFKADPYPSLAVRGERLQALAAMMITHRRQIRAAMSADFAVHPELFSDLVECLGVAGRAAYAAEQLASWAAPEPRFTDPALYGTARATVRMQPKGVIGNIVPWNFPFDLSAGPLVEMLAAGNRVVIKPSDYTPACAELLQQMLAATFDPDLVTVAIGGIDLAREFTTVRWDHLLYTGSPAVGREVAVAAARNLVPVTLELGGKCPAVIAPDSVDEATVRTILGTKMIKNGQMCVSVDYCLVPRDQVATFVELAQQWVAREVPDYATSSDNTGIISSRHLDRLVDLLAEARDAGAQVVELGGTEIDRTRRLMPLSLVVDPPAHLGVMREEIFGPILPIVSYDSLEQALVHINDQERPLALYAFAHDEQVGEAILAATTSGGACLNTCASQSALPSMGFGGIGQSGSGRHHGIEGFREFSNPRGVFVRGTDDLTEAFLPPYGATTEAIVAAAFGDAG